MTYVTLAQIEDKAQINSADRRSCSEVAARIIREGAQAWAAKQTTNFH